jgi:hypothetical protein
MLPSSPHKKGQIRPQAITGICFNDLGAINFSISLLLDKSAALKTFGGAEFKC